MVQLVSQGGGKTHAGVKNGRHKSTAIFLFALSISTCTKLYRLRGSFSCVGYKGCNSSVPLIGCEVFSFSTRHTDMGNLQNSGIGLTIGNIYKVPQENCKTNTRTKTASDVYISLDSEPSVQGGLTARSTALARRSLKINKTKNIFDIRSPLPRQRSTPPTPPHKPSPPSPPPLPSPPPPPSPLSAQVKL